MIFRLHKICYKFEALASADPFLMLLAEYTFVIQELESGYPEEKEALASYRAARSAFDDAFRALEVVKNAAVYHGVEKAFPCQGDYRHNGYPKMPSISSISAIGPGCRTPSSKSA
jgi:hypothetical protein